jgi:hypothetical protein
MTTTGWMAGAIVAGSVLFTIKSGCLQDTTKAPDERIAARLDDLCAIARDNISTPERGVKKLGHYLGKHAGDLFGDWGSTLAAIERIGDDRKHDDRARLARDRIRRPLRACQTDWARFGQAVDSDPKASALVERFSIRLNRTFEIIFSGTEAVDLRSFPLRLERALDRAL